MQPWQPPELRFTQGDRVLCNVGERWIAGTVLSTNVDDPEEPGDLIPYVIKTDPLMGESRTISAPVDSDGCILRERCFNQKNESELTRWSAPIAFDKAKKLRFGVGDAVAIRAMDTSNGFECWLDAKVSETWATLPFEKEEGMLKAAEAVPYVVVSKDHNVTFYCHRDEHTLIRKPENKPQKPGKTVSKRFEIRERTDGKKEKFDHVTLRGKVVDEIDEDSN